MSPKFGVSKSSFTKDIAEIKAIQKLGLEEQGGVTRLGVSVYNNEEEIENTIKVISQI